MTDIQFDLGETRVNLRVAALIVHAEKILICRVQTEDWYFLPGGRIKTNESSLEAIQREIEEEIGTKFDIVRPIVIAENFFGLANMPFHEICIFYLVEWLDDSQNIKMSAGEELCWIPRQDVVGIDLRPALIKSFIIKIPDQVQLVISRE